MSKAPNIPTGPRAGSKGISKPMKPMPKANPSRPGTVKPNGSSSVSPSKQGQTVKGSPKK
jgi:hypothetical protein